jgi:hypothetical protein
LKLETEIGVKRLGPSSAQGLGLVHGGVRFLQHALGAPGPARRHRHADARRHLEAPFDAVVQFRDQTAAQVDGVEVTVDLGR